MEKKSSLKGIVYGDIIGAPFSVKNTDSRYFEIGMSQREIVGGRIKNYFPGVTEASHGSAAVSRWLRGGTLSVEQLLRELRTQHNSHSAGDWSPQSKTILSSENSDVSTSSDWGALVRTLPIGPYFNGDIARAMEAAEACVKATCWNMDAIDAARAVTEASCMAASGADTAQIRTMLEHAHSLNINIPERDLRYQLQGYEKIPVVILGQRLEGEYTYRRVENPEPPSASLIATAALKAVLKSDSWEDAVRTAVSYGGPSNAVGAIAGSIAELIYGEVTPSIVGKLNTYVPSDIVHDIETQERLVRSAERTTPRVNYEEIARDSVTAICLGGNHYCFIVAEGREEIENDLEDVTYPHEIVRPGDLAEIVERYRGGVPESVRDNSTTFEWGIRPEIVCFYHQDGKFVSPSSYVGTGMPSLQERKRNREAFESLWDYCLIVQQQMNRLAGNEAAGQVHYGDAYHLWLGKQKIDFFYGDQRVGSVTLDSRGLLRLDLGEYRDVSVNARFENYVEQLWIARGVFREEDSICPLERIETIKREISERLLDEGLGCGFREPDGPYSSESIDISQISNIERLEKLDAGEILGISFPSKFRADPQAASPEKAQAVRQIYTIGYGARSEQGFIGTLEMLGIDTVIDIRAYTKSRATPQFNESSIYQALEDRGITYLNGSDALSGKPENEFMYDSFRVADWDKIRGCNDYKQSIGRIAEIAAEGHLIAIASSKADPLSSHRFGLIAPDLQAAGLEVRHILASGEVVGHGELESRMIENYSRRNWLCSAVSGSYKEQLREAYKLLNSKVGAHLKRRAEFSRIIKHR